MFRLPKLSLIEKSRSITLKVMPVKTYIRTPIGANVTLSKLTWSSGASVAAKDAGIIMKSQNIQV